MRVRVALRGNPSAPITPPADAGRPFQGLIWNGWDGSKGWRPIPLRGTGPGGPCYLPLLLPIPTITTALHPASASLPAPLIKREGNGKRGQKHWQGMGCPAFKYSGVIARRTR